MVLTPILTQNKTLSFDFRCTFCTRQIFIGGKRKRAKVVLSCPTPSPVRVSIYVDNPSSLFFVLLFPTFRDPHLYTLPLHLTLGAKQSGRFTVKSPFPFLYFMCILLLYVTGACRWSSCEALMNGRSLLTLEP